MLFFANPFLLIARPVRRWALFFHANPLPVSYMPSKSTAFRIAAFPYQRNSVPIQGNSNQLDAFPMPFNALCLISNPYHFRAFGLHCKSSQIQRSASQGDSLPMLFCADLFRDRSPLFFSAAVMRTSRFSKNSVKEVPIILGFFLFRLVQPVCQPSPVQYLASHTRRTARRCRYPTSYIPSCPCGACCTKSASAASCSP